MKTRLLGAAVLIALAVLFVPMFFSNTPPAANGDESVSLAIPPAPDRDLQTKTMSLTPGAAPSATAAAAPRPAEGVNEPSAPGAAPVSSDKLATVNIGSNRPRDVETDPAAGKKPEPTTVTRADGSTANQPVIPIQNKPAATQPVIPAQTKPAEPAKAAPPVVPSTPPATAARGQFTLNLSAYASASSAQNLVQRVQGLGYPASSRQISQGGKPLTLVTAGPFETRAAAEAARLKITQSIPGAPARLEGSASTPAGDAPAPAAAAKAPAAPGKPGGWAVQVAAMGTQGDANALRDRLRANGFDGYVDTVNAGGKQLWRVRAGPQTQRDDAVRVRDQIKTKLGLDGNVVAAP
ncbi:MULTISPECIES: SPOR domain-containing protein [Dyella]|uniref:SPOR domain-containing protein n=2 Tax=Dyella TaxID=231454 RepID=A0A4R0YV72_9GAMM|nr:MULTISPECIES: SPOR domain-containing protein [Dyella]TBR39087.1 SPOR domain-containing protein [Dyella terrae]TCI13325.1 SPOR domain-containing protein [Dyella soli]